MLFAWVFTELRQPFLVPNWEVWPSQWPCCTSVRLNNDAGSPPRGPRQMASASLRPPPWPRSPPLALCVHLHPNTPIIIFIPAAPRIRPMREPFPQLLSPMLTGKMNHLDSAVVCRTMPRTTPHLRTNICRITNNPAQRKFVLGDIFQELVNLFSTAVTEELSCCR